MGRPTGPRTDRTRSTSRLAAASFWLVAVLACGCLCAAAPSAQAQTLADPSARRAASPPGRATDHMLLNAREMIYNQNGDTVEATGDVQIYYQGRALQADRVLYNRAADRVAADGHVKLTNADGSVVYADKMDLTQDFKDGFIESLRADAANQTHFSAARAERAAGETTILDRATYTACEPCKNNPEKPPFWQVRAKRIVHDNEEQVIYFEDADFELMGIPIAYLPYFSVPDPSVKRKSGLLAPGYIYNASLGFGVSTPVFWAIAPNYDLTVTPTFYTRQGLFLQTEWRHQLANGAYAIRLSGIFQNDAAAFLPPPNGAGSENFRGEIETWSDFYINKNWRFGWNVNLVTDKFFITDYRSPSLVNSNDFFREAVSTAYLTGQGEHGFFDLRGFYIQGLSRYDVQEQQPVVAPVIDYNKTFDLDPKATAGIGGRVEIDANATHLSRQLAAFQAAGPRTLDSAFNLYDVCTVYAPGKCLVRGIGGDYTRATLNASWQRRFIDPIGETWTPFVFAHLDGSVVDLNQTYAQTYGASTIANSSQNKFFGPNDNTTSSSFTPGAGLEWRYPFVMANDWATHIFEPIAQIIVRPNAPANQSLINEDAQSLVFDDSNLFEWNKYSGYDRFEGGTRANYGAQYTMTFKNGAYVNALVGQSFQVAGQNSYATPDAANVGISSGLDGRASDLVTRLAVSSGSTFAAIAKARFDPGTYALRRLDLSSTAKLGAFEATLQYARYESQPLIGFDKQREGISTALKYKMDRGLFTSGSVIFDLSRHLYDSNPQVGGNAPLFAVAGFGAELGYADDCTTVSLNYTQIYQDNGYGVPVLNQTIMAQIQLRTLGDAKISTSLGNIGTQDGLSSLH